MFERFFKEVSRVFHESFMEEEVSRMFQGCFIIFKGVSECFKEVSRKLSRCFKKVSCSIALIGASRAEGGLVSYLLHEFILFDQKLDQHMKNI